MLPNKEILLEVIEKTQDGAVCEWSAIENQVKKVPMDGLVLFLMKMVHL